MKNTYTTTPLAFNYDAVEAAVEAAKPQRSYTSDVDDVRFVWAYTITVGPLVVSAYRQGRAHNGHGRATSRDLWTIRANPSTLRRLTSEIFQSSDLTARAKTAIAKGEATFPWHDAEFVTAKRALDAARGLAFEILAQWDWPSDAYRDAALQV